MIIQYRFLLKGGEDNRFELRLDPKTLALIPAADEPAPGWARLGNKQCPHCPLRAETSPYCPVARNLAGIIQEFAHHISFEEGDIIIRTEDREYRRRAPLQNGISSLIGVVMVTSGCPHLDKLRPMVYTHLPFASTEETVYRAVSMYLLAQYLRRGHGLSVDWDLDGLAAIYDAISQVNSHFVERLKTMEMEDANLNAVVKLDCFAVMTSTMIGERSLAGVEDVFQAYLRP